MPKAILFLLISLFSASLALAEVSVTKTAKITLFGQNFETADQARAVLLSMAKESAVQEIFGEFIRSMSKVENFSLTSNEIESTSVGFIRVRGNPRYYAGEGFGEVCVSIDAYVRGEDLDTLNPRSLTKKVVVADPNLTLKEVEKEAKKQARLQALIEYDNNLKKYDPDQLLPLLHEAKYTDGHFIEGTTAYSIEMSGVIYPLEVLALQNSRQAYGPAVPLVTALPNNAFTASSVYPTPKDHGPWLAKFGSTSGASNWSAKTSNSSQWLQIDLGGKARIEAIGTMGRLRRANQWVSSYKLSFSLDGRNWDFCSSKGASTPTVFPGNSDRTTEVRNTLPKPIVARYVRFHPVTWSQHITMRVELYGSMTR